MASDVVLFLETGPENGIFPGFKVTEHVTSGSIGTAHGNKTGTASLFKSGIDKLGDTEECINPVVVTTAENGVRYLFHLIAGQVFHPLDELTLKIRWGHAVSQSTVEEKVVRLDGEVLLDLQFVVGVGLRKVEVLEQQSHCEKTLLPCEWSSDTSSLTVAERLPAVGELFVQPGEFVVKHTFRNELLGIGFTLLDEVLSSKEGVFDSFDTETGDGRADSEGLSQHGAEVGQLGEVFHGDRVAANDLVDLLLKLVVGLWVLEKVVHGER
ncbi:hypothetical protein HG531_009789 [Fusarium graminearum]|nr:hypothetical protein HG531_009789 [Fusarium graminearum]